MASNQDSMSDAGCIGLIAVVVLAIVFWPVTLVVGGIVLVIAIVNACSGGSSSTSTGQASSEHPITQQPLQAVTPRPAPPLRLDSAPGQAPGPAVAEHQPIVAESAAAVPAPPPSSPAAGTPAGAPDDWDDYFRQGYK